MKAHYRIGGTAIGVETERFRLRTLRVSDASERYLSWIADAAVMAPLNMPTRKLSLSELRSHISQFDNKSKFLVGMFDRESGVHFGVYIIDVLARQRLARLQYLIGDAGYRGIGAFQETLEGLVGHLFARRGVEKIAAQVNVGNEASVAGLQATGFRIEGEMKGEIRSFEDGSRIDQYFLGILKTEWAEQNEGKG